MEEDGETGEVVGGPPPRPELEGLALGFLRGAHHGLTASQLAEGCRVSKRWMTKVLNGMLARGAVRRKRHSFCDLWFHPEDWARWEDLRRDG